MFLYPIGINLYICANGFMDGAAKRVLGCCSHFTAYCLFTHYLAIPTVVVHFLLSLLMIKTLAFILSALALAAIEIGIYLLLPAI